MHVIHIESRDFHNINTYISKILDNIFLLVCIQFQFLNILRSMYKNSSNDKKNKKRIKKILGLHIENLILQLCAKNIENYIKNQVFDVL